VEEHPGAWETSRLTAVIDHGDVLLSGVEPAYILGEARTRERVQAYIAY